MAQRIVWSPKAVSQLEEICDYIAKDSPFYATVFARNVIAVVRGLPRFPRSGRVVPEYGDDNLREKILGNYRIVYRLRAGAIEIAAICHAARHLSETL